MAGPGLVWGMGWGGGFGTHRKLQRTALPLSVAEAGGSVCVSEREFRNLLCRVQLCLPVEVKVSIRCSSNGALSRNS